MTIDLDGRYRVAGMDGVAFWLRGWTAEGYDEDMEPILSDTFVDAVMVGDDRVHVVDVDDLEPISDEDYCGVCGQIGCGHDGR